MKAIAHKKIKTKDTRVEQIDPVDDRLVMVMFPYETWEMVVEMAEEEGSDPAGIISAALNMYRDER